MLQWMGGSRRKITTSRKSTQKRQKQYFEQRKRQQQQQEAAFTENNIDGLVTCDHQKKNRSLDILSLFNVPTVSEECNPLFERSSSMNNKATCGSFVEDVDPSLTRKSDGHAFSESFHTSTSTPNIITNECAAKEELPTETRVPSLHQVGRVSSRSTRGNPSNSKNIESEHFCASSIQSSIFDIIGDDGSTVTSEGEPLQESHVAFSIEGLGKVGTNTPLQSPQHPGSKLNGEQSSFTKAAKHLNSCKNIDATLNDLEMEVECLMQDVENPSCRSRLSGDNLHPFSSNVDELLTFKDGMQLDGKQCGRNSLYDEDRQHHLWDDISLCSYEYEVDKKCGVNWKKFDTIKNSFTWRNDSSDFRFERRHSQSPLRCQEKIPVRINLDGDCCFPSFDKSRYTSFACNYPQQDCFSSFMKQEDTREKLTSFSGESCSSSAVGGKSTADMPFARRGRRYGKDLDKPSKFITKEDYGEGMYEKVGCDSTADMPSTRHRRRYGKDLDKPLKSNTKEDYGEGMWNMMSTTIRRGEERHSSLFSHSHVNQSEGYCLFEEFSLPKTNSHPESFCSLFEKNQHWIGDPFGLDTEADFRRSKCFTDGSEKDSPPNEFSSKRSAFQQPSYIRHSSKKAVYGESMLDAFDFEVHVQSSNSSGVFENIASVVPAPELSAQGSISEEKGDKSESQSPCPEKLIEVSTENKNTTTESLLPTHERTSKNYGVSHNRTNNDISREVYAHTLVADAEETSLSIKFQDDSDNKLSTPTKDIPVLCHQKVKVCVDDAGCFEGNGLANDNLEGSKPKTKLIDPCYQLMTVERYVLKLFGVP